MNWKPSLNVATPYLRVAKPSFGSWNFVSHHSKMVKNFVKKSNPSAENLCLHQQPTSLTGLAVVNSSHAAWMWTFLTSLYSTIPSSVRLDEPLCCSLLHESTPCNSLTTFFKSLSKPYFLTENQRVEVTNMSNTGFSTFVSLLVASCFCYSSAMPTPNQEAANDRPVIGKLKLRDKC